MRRRAKRISMAVVADLTDENHLGFARGECCTEAFATERIDDRSKAARAFMRIHRRCCDSASIARVQTGVDARRRQSRLRIMPLERQQLDFGSVDLAAVGHV